VCLLWAACIANVDAGGFILKSSIE